MVKLERISKGAGRAAARLLLRPAPRRPGEVDLGALRRILVVRQDRRLGNLVLLTSLLQGLRRAAPRAAIHVVAPHGFAAVLDPHPAVDRVLPIDHRLMLRAPWKAAAWRRYLRGWRPELAIDASPVHSASFLNGLITWGSGAGLRLGYARPDADLFLNLLAPPPAAAAPAGAIATHESVLLHDLLRQVASHLPPAPRPHIGLPSGAGAFARRAYRRWGIDDGTVVVGLHPGGRRHKRWPVERFEAVARALAARGRAVLVFSGPAERPLLDLMSPPGPRRVYAPPTGVGGLRALLAELDAFVSGDCGPMHLAAALEVPCVAIFRVGDQARYGPLGPAHRVLHRPGGEVEPEEVVGAVEAVLGAPRQVRGAAERRSPPALSSGGTP